MKTLAALLAPLALALGVAATPVIAAEANPDTLKVALLPDENAGTVIQNNQPLKKRLENALGRKIELVVTTDYSSMIEATRFGRIDVAYFGPVSYTMAKEKMAGGEIDIEPFAALRKGDSASYQSVLIAHSESGIETVDMIKGRNLQVAFGDPASTSSHFAPKFMLMKAGIQPGDDYAENFVGAHDAVAKNVERGNAQVGGLSRPIFESLVSRGVIDKNKVRVLGYSDDIPQYPWVMRTNLDPQLREAIKTAFLSLDKTQSEDAAILKPFKADGFLPVDDKAYDVIREIRKNVMGQ
jgi:phosphonate transport system substrate-binding protein